MKPMLQITDIGHSGVDPVVCLGLIGIEQKPVGDAEWIQEAIDLRANSVGSVMEEILKGMEVHSHWGINE